MRDALGRFTKGYVPPNKARIVLTCQYCLREFEVPPSRKDQKFCSSKCRQSFLESRRIKKQCLICGREIVLTPSKSQRGKYCSWQCYRLAIDKGLVKYNPWLKGRKAPIDLIQRLREAHLGKRLSPQTEFKKGNIPWWKKLGYKNLMQIPEIKEKHRKNVAEWWKSPEYVSKQMRSRGVKPNKKEQLLDQILQTNFPNEWKYVGDGSFVLKGLCPDWININGRKKVIDLFGCFYHGCPIHYPSRKPEPHLTEPVRRTIFEECGYNYLVIWEHELKDGETLLRKLEEFTYA